jgi:hypothetical protein
VIQTSVDRRTLPAIILTLSSFVLGACGDDGGSKKSTMVFASDPFSEEVLVGSHTQLTVLGVNGTIEVHGDATATSVSISGTMKVGSDSLDDAQQHLSDMDVVVTEAGTEVLVETDQPDGPQTGGRDYIVEYTITLPDTMKIVVVQVNGEVLIDAMNADIDATQVNGPIGADVVLPPGGQIDLGTANGDISLTIPKDTSAELSCLSATGTVSDSNLDILNPVRTDHSLSGTLGGGDGTIELSNANGDITVKGI